MSNLPINIILDINTVFYKLQTFTCEVNNTIVRLSPVDIKNIIIDIFIDLDNVHNRVNKHNSVNIDLLSIGKMHSDNVSTKLSIALERLFKEIEFDIIVLLKSANINLSIDNGFSFKVTKITVPLVYLTQYVSF